MSSERSGSNLLRRILDASERVAGPPAPHLLKAFGPHWGALALDSREVRTRVVDLATRLVREHMSPWPLELKSDRLCAHLDATGWDAVHLFDAVHTEYARHVGKEGYFAKENRLFDYAHQLAEAFPDARFVYLVRDPRDVALSFMRAPAGPVLPLSVARLWRREQSLCLEAERQLGRRCYRIRYEDLLADPEQSVRDLFVFLELPFSPRMLAPSARDGGEATKTAFWSNLDKPVLRGNAGKFRLEGGLRQADIARVEAVCGALMEELGYARVSPQRFREPGPLVSIASMSANYALQRLLPSWRMPKREQAVRRQRRRLYREVARLARRPHAQGRA